MTQYAEGWLACREAAAKAIGALLTPTGEHSQFKRVALREITALTPAQSEEYQPEPLTLRPTEPDLTMRKQSEQEAGMERARREQPAGDGLVERIDAAIERVISGRAQMRIPVDQTDSDIVLSDCKTRIADLERKLAEANALRESMADELQKARDQRHDTWCAARTAEAERDALKADAERYRRIRENWIDCDELNLYGRLSVVDAVVDAARGKL